jgi:hypothetical protein
VYPNCSGGVVGQLGEPAAQGQMLLPWVMSWKAAAPVGLLASA